VRAREGDLENINGLLNFRLRHDVDRRFDIAAMCSHSNEPPKAPFLNVPLNRAYIRLKFTKAGQFTWHCHILEHEDNEMMRPYRIGPPQSGQPV
jgi:hypothetical protein